MDTNQIEKIKIGFGPQKAGDCTLVWDKKAKEYHLLELQGKDYLVDKRSMRGLKEEGYSYILENWQIIYQNIK